MLNKRIMILGISSLSLACFSHGFGEVHNRYLDCFDEAIPAESQPTINDLLTALLSYCGYTPPDCSNFVNNYGLLGQSTLFNLAQGGLLAVVKPYGDKFQPLHINYLHEVEEILSDSPSFQEAYEKLEWLYKDALPKFRGKENADIAVLAAIDIAAHSSLYWGSQEQPPIPLRAKWWQVVLADVAGGVVGGLFGGGVGAVGLGSACSGYVARL